MYSRPFRIIAVFSLIFCSVIFPCLILIFSGTVTISLSGFAVDSDERLYIGSEKEIRVYENGALRYSIDPRTSRSYAFTISEDGNILLSTSSTVYKMDLEGNVLDSRNDPGADTYNQIRYNRAEFTSSNNNSYKLTDFLGWTRIVRNDTKVVYQIDPLSYIVKILLCCSIVSAFAFVLWLLKAFVKPKIDSGNGIIFL